MQMGLRAILLLVAIILFIVAAVSNGDNSFDFLALALACMAGALLVEELGLGTGRRFGTGRAHRP